MGDSQKTLFRPRAENIVNLAVRNISGASMTLRQEELAVEEPLEIRLGYHFKGRASCKAISLTMRTPGHDRELAAGFLVSEGIIRDPADISAIRHIGSEAANEIQVDLDPSVDIDFARLERHFYTTSSCGVCGKTSLQAIEMQTCESIPIDGFCMDAALIHEAPARLRESQPVFSHTGGLHAAALFDETGGLLSVREDVGRHNALDKLIGERFLAGCLPLHNRLLLVSGRASFELMQKAVMAGIPAVAAVGAPSSLAVELAQHFHMTLLGFVRNQRFNIYSGHWRIKGT
jgi:FdhD protein